MRFLRAPSTCSGQLMRLRPIRLLPEVTARYSSGSSALVISGSYVALVIGVAAFGWISTSIKPASLAGMWIFLVTQPSSSVIHLVPAQGKSILLLDVLGGFVQAWLLWAFLRGKRLPRDER